MISACELGEEPCIRGRLIEVAAIFPKLFFDPRFHIIAEDLEALDVGFRTARQIDVAEFSAGKIDIIEHGVRRASSF